MQPSSASWEYFKARSSASRGRVTPLACSTTQLSLPPGTGSVRQRDTAPGGLPPAQPQQDRSSFIMSLFPTRGPACGTRTQERQVPGIIPALFACFFAIAFTPCEAAVPVPGSFSPAKA